MPPVEDADTTADDLIRKMMVAQKRATSRDILPELDPPPQSVHQDVDPGTEPVKHPRKKFKLTRARKTIKKAEIDGVSDTAPPGRKSRLLTNVASAIKGYRPSRKHIFFGGVAVVVFLRPWLIPITLFVAFWVVLIAYFTLGPDRVAELVAGSWQRLHSRRPELAEIIRRRAEATAQRVDAFLDRMPDRWRDGIHVPDFSSDQGIADDRPDPFEKLGKEAQHG